MSYKELQYGPMIWAVGQRVVAELEPELGLGSVVAVDGKRFVEVHFPGAELHRRYALSGAPLRRVVLPEGRRIQLKDGHVGTISAVREAAGLVFYRVDGKDVPESELDHVVDTADPVAEALSGRWDSLRSSELREMAWRLRRRGLDPQVRGLAGARVSLLPHQLHVANELARRDFPRALLADEVGLGKTIEAGLVFASLRASERATRVLVLAPEALKYQWLAEMYRRFQELFTVVDEDHALEEGVTEDSVFRENRRVICSRDFLLDYPDWLEEALAAPWDLLIVDEAHHLEWTPEEPGASWEMVKALAQNSRGVLLLTATPERRGLETEFGLLHLVAPERFPDFDKFQDEMAGMREVAGLATRIQNGDRDNKLVAAVKKRFASDPGVLEALKAYQDGGAPDGLLRPLLDRHGTSRVLVRNRRTRIQGFPDRVFVPHKLEAPPALAERLAGFVTAAMEDEEVLRIASGRWRSPKEPSAQHWFLSRAKWVLSLVKTLKDKKILLICASAKRAMDLNDWLKKEGGVRAALFHEGLDLVERDRQAAWFAEPEGAQVLVCSEIGSEGRNFQFAYNLVLFDLPLHPDVLEQRIGRVDRIGQRFPVKIHVPYFAATPEEVLARWYGEGLESFTRPWNGGLIEELIEPLADTCRVFLAKSPQFKKREGHLDELIEATREAVKEIRRRQSESTDVLVDLNSFDEVKGRALADRIRHADEDAEIERFLEAAFEIFGVELEHLDDAGTVKLAMHSLSFVENFPGLSEKGEKICTFDRRHALEREELEYLGWDHPIVQAALTLVIEGRTGRVAAGIWESGGALKTPLLELNYVVQVTAPRRLEVDEDLPAESLKVYIPLGGVPGEAPKGLETAKLRPVATTELERWRKPVETALANTVEKAERIAQEKTRALAGRAAEGRKKRLGEENRRLVELARLNGSISEAELKEHRTRLEEGVAAILKATPRLDALRLILPG